MNYGNTNTNIPTPSIGGYGDPFTPGAQVPNVDVDSGNPANIGGSNSETAPGSNKSFDWGSLLNFGGLLVQNSGQLASTFSPNYRQDQIDLAQNQSFFSRNAPTFGSSPEERQKNQNLIAIIAVSVVVVVIMVFLLKRGKNGK
jgi:hypothetical protein